MASIHYRSCQARGLACARQCGVDACSCCERSMQSECTESRDTDCNLCILSMPCSSDYCFVIMTGFAGSGCARQFEVDACSCWESSMLCSQ